MTERRPLTEDELFVLRLVQEAHGFHNTEADVFFTDPAEAVITARGPEGDLRVFVSLTNLADWYRSGQISMEDMRAWISPPNVA